MFSNYLQINCNYHHYNFLFELTDTFSPLFFYRFISVIGTCKKSDRFANWYWVLRSTTIYIKATYNIAFYLRVITLCTSESYYLCSIKRVYLSIAIMREVLRALEWVITSARNRPSRSELPAIKLFSLEFHPALYNLYSPELWHFYYSFINNSIYFMEKTFTI